MNKELQKLIGLTCAFLLLAMNAKDTTYDKFTIEEVNYVLLLAPRYEKMYTDLNKEIADCKKILAKKPSDHATQLQLSVAQTAQLVICQETCSLFDWYRTKLASIKTESQKEDAEIKQLLERLNESFAFLKSEQVDA